MSPRSSSTPLRRGAVARRDLRADPRVVALLHSLEEWLPAPIAYERAMNAAAPLLLLESLQQRIAPTMLLDPEDAIASSLSNTSAMHGVLAPAERVEGAVRAWLRAARAPGPGAPSAWVGAASRRRAA